MIKCFFENGNRASLGLRHAIVDAIIINNNKILLIKRAADSITNPNKFALPGGFINRDETTAQAVIREALEETGYQTEIVNLLTVIDNPARPQEDRQNIAFIFILKPLEKTGNHDHEVENIYWFSLDQLPDKSDFAFDHYQTIELYKKYLKEKLKIPIINIKQ